MELRRAIIAILFYTAEPTSVTRLARLLRCQEDDIRSALADVDTILKATGLCLMRNGDNVILATAPEASTLIEKITTEELSKELSKAALETLAIILYKGPITRGEIDYIRGVNSTFILRNLQVRGLIERIEHPNDQRSFLYKPTFQLLEYLGVSRVEDLPKYHDTLATLSSFIAEQEMSHDGGGTESHQSLEHNASSTLSVGAEGDEDVSIEATASAEDLVGQNVDDGALQEHHDEARP